MPTRPAVTTISPSLWRCFEGEGLARGERDADVEDAQVRPSTRFRRGSATAKGTRDIWARGAPTTSYDDTPLIEITGEFEIDPETAWEDLLDDRPEIPKEPGPNVSNYVIWVAVAVLVFALYYLIAR